MALEFLDIILQNCYDACIFYISPLSKNAYVYKIN